MFASARTREAQTQASSTKGMASPFFQAKLTVNTPGDAHEQEADRVADQVMRMREGDAPIVQRMPLTSVPVQRAPTAGAMKEEKGQVQRKCANCENEEKEKVQRKEGGSNDAGGHAAPSIVSDVLSSGGGQQMDGGTRQFMESRFGQDFSQVRIHTGEQAAESAAAIQARAYTSGRDVVFGRGEYQPDSEGGRRLLAHELVHVGQQGTKSGVQRLIRTPYPWDGVVTPASGVNIRSSPSSVNRSNILGAIPQNERVTVVGNSADWLRVESNYTGSLISGYVLHNYVDDATSARMDKNVGTTMVWRPSGPGSGTDFQRWAAAPRETTFAVTSTTRMNCWEAVLLSAYQAGALSWQWIHNLYTNVPQADWVSTMSRGQNRRYSVPGPNQFMPQRGDIVFFDGLAHIALATGNSSEVFTFWPPPNTPFARGGTTDKVKKFTIEVLFNWWATNMPPQPVVEFGAPAW